MLANYCPISYDSNTDTYKIDDSKLEDVNDNDNSLSSGTGQCEREEVAGSTSALTFQVCIRSGGPNWNGNDVYIGRSNRSDNQWYNSMYVRSTFRILEIAA